MIAVKVITHKNQRYPTSGDWQWLDSDGKSNRGGGNDLLVSVSNVGDDRYHALVAVHEIVEALICRAVGIEQYEADDFDITFETARKPGDEREPGDQLEAPYYLAHQIATGIERILAVHLGVDWNEYEAAIGKLFSEPPSSGTLGATAKGA